jgi:periplasmic protein TonB
MSIRAWQGWSWVASASAHVAGAAAVLHFASPYLGNGAHGAAKVIVATPVIGIELVSRPPASTASTIGPWGSEDADAATPPNILSSPADVTRPVPKVVSHPSKASEAGGGTSDGASEVAAAADGFTGDPKMLQAYGDTLLTHLERFKRYPEEAKRRGRTGVVRVSFSVSRAGDVVEARLAEPSGETSLDEEALATLWRAEPLPRLPDQLPATVTFTLPISFDLTKHS